MSNLTSPNLGGSNLGGGGPVRALQISAHA